MKIKTIAIVALAALFAACGKPQPAPTEAETPADGEQVTAAEGNAVVDAIMSRRSVRKYLDTPVEHEKLQLIAECGINAPSGMNEQPWAVRVVEDKSFIDKLTEIYKKVEPERVAKDKDFKNMFRNAPNLICVAVPKSGKGQLDAGMLGENMMLAAQSLGLGTCCLGGPVHFLLNTPECAPYLEKLNIPADYELCYILAVGYPDESPAAKQRDASKIEYIR